MTAQLKLNLHERYSIVALVFFITYVILQPPATIMMRFIGPRIFLSSIVFLWGLVMLGMGFAKDWTTLVGLRLVLGIFEAGFFPGTVYLMSTYYQRYEMGKRYAVFYTIGVFASALGGVLGYGLMQMSGLAGLLGWYVLTYTMQIQIVANN
jgi:MFS family permease